HRRDLPVGAAVPVREQGRVGAAGVPGHELRRARRGAERGDDRRRVQLRDATNSARGNRAYLFEFDDPDAPRRPGYEDVSFPLGSYHTAEIQYVFGAAPGVFTPAQAALSRRIQRYWTTFARS